MHSREIGPIAQGARRVLVAEDDAVTRRILHHWLTVLGYDVTTASDGLEAWEILQQPQPPELVVMDWVMPGLDGIELCHRLRDPGRPYYHYILMITGRSDMNHVLHALESGADDCLTKPFEEPELKARLSVACRILDLQDQLIQAREEIRIQAMKDSLTGLWNRAAFSELFELELDRARRKNEETGFLLLDLDHFKQVNDTYGHPIGDIVLRKAAHMLRQNVRSYDFVGRYGGEEFIVAFSTCNADQLRGHSERIRRAFAAQPIRVGTNDIQITFSIGSAIAAPGTKTVSEVLTIADVALYHAKNSGRDRTVFCHRTQAEILAVQVSPHACCDSCDPALASKCICVPADTRPANPPQPEQ
ncbi:MAG TPA: diguanylate cyclase [Terracidiphilus sp.]|jgi:two-component system cell cycle response regulator|nr:diguanylate cyclase [Terracidiphilus sp.]